MFRVRATQRVFVKKSMYIINAPVYNRIKRAVFSLHTHTHTLILICSGDTPPMVGRRLHAANITKQFSIVYTRHRTHRQHHHRLPPLHISAIRNTFFEVGVGVAITLVQDSLPPPAHAAHSAGHGVLVCLVNSITGRAHAPNRGRCDRGEMRDQFQRL